MKMAVTRQPFFLYVFYSKEMRFNILYEQCPIVVLFVSEFLFNFVMLLDK